MADTEVLYPAAILAGSAAGTDMAAAIVAHGGPESLGR
jgi:hypothetical protein